MVKNNYVIREDNRGKTISEDAMLDAIDIEETLMYDYPYLYKSLKESDYKLTVNHCTYFKEIVFKKKVVGFFAYTIINSVSNPSLIACYVLPEYREKGLFFDELNNHFEDGKMISIYQPPRHIMKLLIDYGFAKNISDDIIVTSINIDIPSSNITDFYGTDEIRYVDYITTNLYDKKIDSYIITENENNILYLSKNVDKEDQNLNISEDYFKNLQEVLTKKSDAIKSFIGDIYKNYSNIDNINNKVEKIDFEKLKNLNKNDDSEEEFYDSIKNIQKNKNSLLDDSETIDKKEYDDNFKDVIIYDFLKIFDDNDNIELTNSIIKIDYELKSDYMKNLIIKKGYITDEVEVSEKNKYLKSLKVNELKDILKRNNLTVSGNKSDLINRIIEYVPSNSIIEGKFHISDKGFEFINEHNEIELYNLALKNFYYSEFKKFLSEHDGELNDVSILFLKEHLKVSYKKQDNKVYLDTINALSFIYGINDNVEKCLYYELKKFILGLNPIFLDESLFNYYQPINEKNIETIKMLLLKTKLDLNKEFKNVWENMELKKFIIPYKKSLSILNQMISGDDRDYMNDKIREEYLTKEAVIHDKLDKSKQTTLDIYLS